jgi:hypothetical protein
MCEGFTCDIESSSEAWVEEGMILAVTAVIVEYVERGKDSVV